jgi:NAD(P)-dependent dehydrogenase (short-subunit alcohol dehydrogenase family)
MMIKRKQGLICTISSWGGLSHIFGAAYGAGKSACDRLSAEMALELKPHNVTSVCLYPGIVGTEHITNMAAQMEQENLADQRNAAFTERYNWETPLLTGRVIARLAGEENIIYRTGRVQIVAELAQKYGILDEDGASPVSLRSLRFVMPLAFPGLRTYSQLIPDIKVPWWLLLIWMLSSPKI